MKRMATQYRNNRTHNVREREYKRTSNTPVFIINSNALNLNPGPSHSLPSPSVSSKRTLVSQVYVKHSTLRLVATTHPIIAFK